jgi:hypothetical protein
MVVSHNKEVITYPTMFTGLSKKLENHEHALALYFMYYNSCRIHQTLRVTPAMGSWHR